jgi:hypothetical protein
MKKKIQQLLFHSLTFCAKAHNEIAEVRGVGWRGNIQAYNNRMLGELEKLQLSVNKTEENNNELLYFMLLKI